MPVSTVERLSYIAALIVVLLGGVWSTWRAGAATDIAAESFKAKEKALVGVAGRWEALATDAAADAKACRDKWATVGDRIDTALDNQSKTAIDLQKAMDGFSKQWLSRSAQCTLALVTMEEACRSDIPSY